MIPEQAITGTAGWLVRRQLSFCTTDGLTDYKQQKNYARSRTTIRTTDLSGLRTSKAALPLYRSGVLCWASPVAIEGTAHRLLLTWFKKPAREQVAEKELTDTDTEARLCQLKLLSRYHGRG